MSVLSYDGLQDILRCFRQCSNTRWITRRITHVHTTLDIGGPGKNRRQYYERTAKVRDVGMKPAAELDTR
jgi:hypothetical protein